MQKSDDKHFGLQVADNQNAEYLIIHEDGTFSIPFERTSDNRSSLHPILAHHFRLVHNSQSSQTNMQIIDSKEVKYVPQVQGVKDELGDNNAFNLPSQQYYVDASTSFISVSDPELVLSTEVSNNTYPHNYIIHPYAENTDTSEDTLTPEIQIQNTDHECNKNTEEPKTSTQFYTEITLDEEQCHSLEKNGWILLEFNKKVYLLNKNGLHDITDNNELIQQYKGSTECGSNEILTKNDLSSTEGSIQTKMATPEMRSIYLIEENSMVELKTNETNKYSDVSDLIENQESSVNDNAVIVKEKVCVTEHIKGDAIREEEVKFLNFNKHKCPRFKTNLMLEDLQQKLKLGKTGNGKRLIAKMMSIHHNNSTAYKCNERSGKDAITPSCNSAIYINSGTPKDCPDLEDILELVEQKFMPNADNTGWCSAEDVSATEEIITKLLHVPSSRDMLLGQNVVFTKMTVNISNTLAEGGVETRLRPVVISGRVGQFTSNGGWHFVYLPHMIPNLLKNKIIDVDEFEMSANGLPLPRDHVPKDGCFLHIHINKEHTPTHAVVTIVKRHLPLKLRNESNTTIHVCNTCTAVFRDTEQFNLHHKSCFKKHENLMNLDQTNSNSETSTCDDMVDLEDSISKNRKRMRLHACSACAAIFENEEELNTHQKSRCGFNENNENEIAKHMTEGQSDKVSTVKGYVCSQCKKQFNHITNYRKHLHTHYKSNQKLKKIGSSISSGYPIQDLKIHKCNICSCSYYHAVTLTKHIKSTHINIGSDIIKN